MNKIVLDSNIFIRFLIKDVADQFDKAERIFQNIEDDKRTALVSILVINEVIWILENYYQVQRKVFVPQLLRLLSLKKIKIIETKKKIIANILEKMQKTSIDFTDYYLAEISNGVKVVSFDKDFSKL